MYFFDKKKCFFNELIDICFRLSIDTKNIIINFND